MLEHTLGALVNRIVQPDPKTPPGHTAEQGTSLYYNEFIVYDVAQVKLRYLFWVKM